MSTQGTAQAAKGSVRQPVVAGQFYPHNPKDLKGLINKFYQAANPEDINNVRAIIAPHAGYIYSGPVAAYGYKVIDRNFDTVILLGSNHNGRAPYFKCSVSSDDYYRTPLGLLPVSPIAKELLKAQICTSVNQAHITHIIEVQLPFLQTIKSDFAIVPIVTGAMETKDIAKLAEALMKYIDERTLLVVSSDLSHYYPYKKAVSLDNTCIKAIEAQNLAEVKRCEACGLDAIAVLLAIAEKKGWNSKILDYRNSGDTAGPKDQVVGYTSIAFYEEDFSTKTKKDLIKLARSVLTDYISKGEVGRVDRNKFPKSTHEKRACFVTLKKHGHLRGCIGHILPEVSLIDCIVQNAINAAVHDPRFSPVKKDELPQIDIEISILTIPKILDIKDPEDILNYLLPLKHGVIIKNGSNQSTYLPQVWSELRDKKQFLESLCLKGGMKKDCWKSPDTEIKIYEAIVVKE